MKAHAARLAAMFACAASLATAQNSAPNRLTVELNAAQNSADGCLISFLLTNGLTQDIDAMVLETVLFDSDGQVELLTLFDFGALPVNRPRVRQFVIPGADCNGLGAALINGAQTCQIAGQAATACGDMLDLRTRVGIDLIG